MQVTISFLLQLWLSGFLAITLPLLVGVSRIHLKDLFPTSFRQLDISLYRVALVALLTNVTIGFSLIAASKAEQKKGPVLLEANFLNVIVYCEAALCFMSFLAVCCLYPTREETKANGGLPTYVFPVGTVMAVLLLFYTYDTERVREPVDMYKSIVDECVKRYGLPYFKLREKVTANNGETLQTFIDVLKAMGYAAALLLALALFMKGIITIAGAASRKTRVARAFFNYMLRRHKRIYGYVLSAERWVFSSTNLVQRAAKTSLISMASYSVMPISAMKCDEVGCKRTLPSASLA